MHFREEFDGDDLDRSVWTPHYLPQWSSRARSAATYEVAGSELRLSIPPEQGLWCPEDHEEPLRVSGVQSGVFSGPVEAAPVSSRSATGWSCARRNRRSGAGRRTTASSRCARGWS